MMNGSPEGWECVEQCPVRFMNEQSGNRPVGGDGSKHSDTAAFGGGRHGEGTSFRDSGGASRYFPNFSSEESEQPLSESSAESTVLVGDCREKMAEMPESSVDAIVCDPPYGLTFMERGWDKLGHGNAQQAWHVLWATQAFRVLKPGGHLLAFGGTRTHHRMVCAIEDAGFEIRDSLHWVYGSGFPKSLDVSKQIDKIGGKSIAWFGPWLRQERERRGITQKELAQHFPSKTGGLTGCVANWELGLNIPTVEQFNTLCDVLDLPFDRLEEAEREVVGKSSTGGAAAWINGMKNKEDDAGRYTGTTEWDITSPSTAQAKEWQGWGTALKPAHEPIVMARKPLAEKNVAQNVLTHGTGALNIDATRVGTAADLKASNRTGHSNKVSPSSVYKLETRMHAEPSGKGRWPPNLLLSHSPGCRPTGEIRRVKAGDPNRFAKTNGGEFVARFNKPPVSQLADPDGYEGVKECLCVEGCPVRELDLQSGQLHSPGTNGRKTDKSKFWLLGSVKQHATYTDKGGASRFFPRFEAEPPFRYAAKASRRERNAGLEGMPEQPVRGSGNEFGKMHMWNGENGDEAWKAKNPNKPTANTHPTVKPISLMRWLVRLVTPPGGTVLDPFMGSGSTGCAAVLEGFDFIGIEMDAEYAEIGRRRIAHWSGEPSEHLEKSNGKPEKNGAAPSQMPLETLF